MFNTDSKLSDSPQGAGPDTSNAVRQRLINELVELVNYFFGGFPPSEFMERLHPVIHQAIFRDDPDEEYQWSQDFKSNLLFDSNQLFQFLVKTYELGRSIKEFTPKEP